MSAAITALGEAGAVAEDAPSASGPREGRPGRRYRLSTDSQFVMSGVIGLHQLYVQVADINGRVLGASRRAFEVHGHDQEEVLEALLSLLREVHSDSVVQNGTLSCIVLSVLGVVRDRRTVVLSHGLSMLTGTVVHDRVAEAFEVPVLVENDANCAALAEAEERPSVTTMIGLLAGEILGCGVVLGGRLHRGAQGAAGELTSRQWTELLTLLQSPGDASQILQVFTSAGDGEESAVRFTEDVAARVAHLLSPAVEFLDPDLIVIGGEAAAAEEALTRPFTKALESIIGWSPAVDATALADRTVITGVHLLGARKAYAGLMGRSEPSALRGGPLHGSGAGFATV